MPSLPMMLLKVVILKCGSLGLLFGVLGNFSYVFVTVYDGCEGFSSCSYSNGEATSLDTLLPTQLFKADKTQRKVTKASPNDSLWVAESLGHAQKEALWCTQVGRVAYVGNFLP